MIKIGMAGTIASGKTTVSILLKRRGFPVFNSDQYAKMALHPNNPCFEKIVNRFGKEVIGEDGRISSSALAGIIFHDDQAREDLNAITHPYVKEGLLKFFERNQEIPAVFAEVPLLFDAGWQDLFDHTLVITCCRETAVKRMMEDRDYTEEEANARYDSQMDPAKQCAMADKVIHNDGSLEELDHQINLYIRDLRKEIRHGSTSD